MPASLDNDLLQLRGPTTGTRIVILENFTRRNDEHANEEKCFENGRLPNVASTLAPTPQRGLLTGPRLSSMNTSHAVHLQLHEYLA